MVLLSGEIEFEPHPRNEIVVPIIFITIVPSGVKQQPKKSDLATGYLTEEIILQNVMLFLIEKIFSNGNGNNFS